MVNTESKPQGNLISDPSTWVDQHGDHLYRYAMMRLRNADQAEDIVQETFMAALKAQKQFSGKSTERTWLIGILKHKVVDYIRKAQRERPASEFESDDYTIDHLFDEGGQWKSKANDWMGNPSELMERKEFWVVLEGCLGKMPDKLSQAFNLKMIEDLKSDEVCKILDITPTNLWVILHRARLRLRECLEINWLKTEEARGNTDDN